MAVLKAAELSVYVDVSTGSKLVLYAQDVNLNINRDTKEVSSLGNGGWKTFVSTGSKDWDTDVNIFVCQSTDPSTSEINFWGLYNNAFVEDASVFVSFKPSATGKAYLKGQGWIKNLKTGVKLGDFQSASFSIQGSSALSQLTTP